MKIFQMIKTEKISIIWTVRFTRQWKKKRGRKTIKRAKKVQKPHFHTRNHSNYGKAEINM